MPATKLLGDLAHRGERLWGDRDAFVWQGRRRTYAEVADRCGRTAGLLAAAGVGEGTRVATLSTNVPEAIEVCLAASLVGAVIVPLNVRLTPDDLRYQLDDAEVSHGLVHPLLEPLAEASGLTDRQVWVVGDELDRAVAALGPDCRATRRVPTTPRRGSTSTRPGRPASRRAASSPSGPGWRPTPTWPTACRSRPTTVCSACSRSSTSPGSASRWPR